MTKPPDKFLFMKVGNHAGETWEQILERKRREFEHTGRIFWGYGGNTCHPVSTVQPFARLGVKEHGGILLVMESIDSRAEPDLVPAKEYSQDGVTWEPIPKGIQVTGSRYALILDEIKPGDLEISLAEYEVALGPSAGKPAEVYLQGHIDKGCFLPLLLRAESSWAGRGLSVRGECQPFPIAENVNPSPSPPARRASSRRRGTTTRDARRTSAGCGQ